QALSKVEKVIAGWRVPEKDRGYDPWEYWFGACTGYLVGPNRADAHTEFLDAWDKVRYTPGMTPLDCAVEMAGRFPLIVRREMSRLWTKEYERFISIAGWLQTAMGNRNILLPVAELGEILGVQKMTVSRYRKWAIADGFLKEVAEHTYH